MFELKMQQEKVIGFDNQGPIWEKCQTVELYYYTFEEAVKMANELMENEYTFISITYKED